MSSALALGCDTFWSFDLRAPKLAQMKGLETIRRRKSRLGTVKFLCGLRRLPLTARTRKVHDSPMHRTLAIFLAAALLSPTAATNASSAEARATAVSIEGERFLINGCSTYDGRVWRPEGNSELQPSETKAFEPEHTLSPAIFFPEP